MELRFHRANVAPDGRGEVVAVIVGSEPLSMMGDTTLRMQEREAIGHMFRSTGIIVSLVFVKDECWFPRGTEPPPGFACAHVILPRSVSLSSKAASGMVDKLFHELGLKSRSVLM